MIRSRPIRIDIVYKVVRCSFVSARSGDYGWIADYHINEWVKSVFPLSKLIAFSNSNDAFEFKLPDELVFKAEAKVFMRNPKSLAWNNNSNWFHPFWKHKLYLVRDTHKNNNDFRYLSQDTANRHNLFMTPPRGTVLCDEIRLIKRANRYE